MPQLWYIAAPCLNPHSCDSCSAEVMRCLGGCRAQTGAVLWLWLWCAHASGLNVSQKRCTLNLTLQTTLAVVVCRLCHSHKASVAKRADEWLWIHLQAVKSLLWCLWMPPGPQVSYSGNKLVWLMSRSWVDNIGVVWVLSSLLQSLSLYFDGCTCISRSQYSRCN